MVSYEAERQWLGRGKPELQQAASLLFDRAGSTPGTVAAAFRSYLVLTHRRAPVVTARQS